MNTDDAALLMLTAKLLNVLGRAPKVTGHPYWSYCYYNSFEDHAAEVHFPAPVPLAFSEAQRLERVHSGWLAQIAGAAVGTIIEGYCTDQLRSAFGEIRGYLRQPTTYNDDVLFELAFLNAYRAKGRAVTSEDIGMEWVGRIEYTWSGEEAAFKNMKRGIFPPHSATVNNPWREWIGAQMRGAICGMVAPGDPELAARLAWTDGAVSHVNNGVLGEVFNAMLVALAYTEHSVRTVLEKAIALLPRAVNTTAWCALHGRHVKSTAHGSRPGASAKKSTSDIIGYTPIPMQRQRLSLCISAVTASMSACIFVPCAGRTWTATQAKLARFTV